MVVIPQGLGDPVPVAAMIPPTMNEDQERPVGVTPVYIMELQTLRIVIVRRRADNGLSRHGHCYIIFPRNSQALNARKKAKQAPYSTIGHCPC
jgi:hypothetical protein